MQYQKSILKIMDFEQTRKSTHQSPFLYQMPNQFLIKSVGVQYIPQTPVEFVDPVPKAQPC